ncbi:MAG: thioredoxin family protein [Deltaproteobacteria bacterium]|nr:thioredoxin family protein [Deltaproteobacteria bacterium]
MSADDDEATDGESISKADEPTEEEPAEEDEPEEDEPEEDEPAEDEPEDEWEPGRVKRPEDDYPEADERTLRRAGIGCIALVALVSLAFVWLLDVAFDGLTDLDSPGPIAAPADTPEPSTATHPPEPSTATRPPAPPAPMPRAEIAWFDDLDAAKTAARAQHRPLLIYFEATWEPTSMEARRIAFGDREVRALATGFVPVKIELSNSDDGARLSAQRLGVTAVPQLLLLRADESRLVEDITSMDPPTVRGAMQAALSAFDQ